MKTSTTTPSGGIACAPGASPPCCWIRNWFAKASRSGRGCRPSLISWREGPSHDDYRSEEEGEGFELFLRSRHCPQRILGGGLPSPGRGPPRGLGIGQRTHRALLGAGHLSRLSGKLLGRVRLRPARSGILRDGGGKGVFDRFVLLQPGQFGDRAWQGGRRSHASLRRGPPPPQAGPPPRPPAPPRAGG